MAFHTDPSLHHPGMGTLGEPSIAPKTSRHFGAAALDMLAEAVVVTDDEGEILGTNRAADRLLVEADGFGGEGGRFSPRAMHEAQSLRRAMADVAAGREEAAVVRFTRPSGRAPFLVTVAALRSEDADRRGIVLFIHDPSAPRVPDGAWLGRLYDLTPMEGHVASRLAAGHSLKDIAESRGISVQTVRGHLKQVFAKTGTHRQGELVARLLSGPSPLASEAA